MILPKPKISISKFLIVLFLLKKKGIHMHKVFSWLDNT